jgi:hypothetical protein
MEKPSSERNTAGKRRQLTHDNAPKTTGSTPFTMKFGTILWCQMGQFPHYRQREFDLPIAAHLLEIPLPQ